MGLNSAFKGLKVNLRFITRVTKSCRRTLSWASSIQPAFSIINTVPPCMPTSANRSLFLICNSWTSARIPYLPHAYWIPRPSYTCLIVPIISGHSDHQKPFNCVTQTLIALNTQSTVSVHSTPHSVYWTKYLTLFFHLCLGLTCNLYEWYCATTTLQYGLVTRFTLPTLYRMFLHFITPP